VERRKSCDRRWGGSFSEGCVFRVQKNTHEVRKGGYRGEVAIFLPEFQGVGRGAARRFGVGGLTPRTGSKEGSGVFGFKVGVT